MLGPINPKANEKRLQSAMEYLMTYGWALLVLAVVLVVLFRLGVFNSTSFAPRAQPGSCQVSRPNGPYSNYMMSLQGICSGQLPQFVTLFNGKPSTYAQTAALPATNQLTVIGWVRMINGAAAGVLYGGIAGPLACGPLTSLPSGGTFSVKFDPCDCQSGYCASLATLTLPINQWIMIAYTSDGTGNVNAYGYIPSQTYTASSSSAAFTIPSGFWLIGQYEGPNSDSALNGTLANVQAYNTTLSANEIKAQYIRGIGGAPIRPQSLIGWWPLNGDTKDYSGNGNDGVPANIAYSSVWTSGYQH